MSAIFGETLTFGQRSGPNVQLKVTGDEFYAIYETLDGYTAVSDSDRGQFCYAALTNGVFVSTGIPVTAAAPTELARHLREALGVRHRRFESRRVRSQPTRSAALAHDAALTFGPSNGLLEGRRLSSGAVRGLTILLEFQDVRTTVTTADIDDMLNGQNYTRNGNFCSAREYFRLVSTGKLDYRNDVVGPFRLAHDRSFYVTTLLVKEALDLAVASGVDLSQYDSRHEGILDALNILYAGQTQYEGELWPHNSTIDLRYGSVSTNMYLLTSAGRNASDLSIGTFCHENGHLLCRFPDMYDYGAVNREGDGVKSAGIGAYCLMGSGNHLNAGRTPAPVCAYLRDLAGWCDTELELNGAGGEREAEHGRYDMVLKYKTAAPNEYFIVENRCKLGLDGFLPSSGLAVYHCDTNGSNEFQDGLGSRHYQCALLQADGHADLEHNVNQGDGTDLYASVAGTALAHDTSPSSRLWNGADSGLVIGGIGVPDNRVRFRTGAAAPRGALHAENTTPLDIPDNNADGVRSRIAVANAAGAIEQLRVDLNLSHTYIGDLEVELVGPDGTKAILHKRSGGNSDNLVARYETGTSSALAAFVGKPAQGDWFLALRDLEGQDQGRLERWSLDLTLQGTAATVVRGDAAPDVAIPDASPQGVTSAIALAATGTVRSLKVVIDITHTFIGDLRIELVSPTGRSVMLHARLGGGQDNLVTTYDSALPLSPLSGLIGQSIQGTWTLRVADLAPEDKGTLNRWSVEVTPA
jgi:M6 family metalloprotease-like protein